MTKWLRHNKQFVIATVIFSIFGTGVAFGLPYVPSDAMLDPTCAPGDAGCYVSLMPTLTAGSIPFSDGATLTQDNTNFNFNDTTNQLYAKYAKTDSVEYADSTFSKAYKVFPNATYGTGVFIGKSLFSGAGAQTITSNPTDASVLSGGVAIGEAILNSFTGAWGISNSVFIGNRIFTSSVGDPTLTVAIGAFIGGTGEQNQGVFLGEEVLGGSSASYGYSGAYGHKNVGIGRQAMYKTNSGLNTAVGALALSRLTTGSNNVAIGAGAGNGVTNIVQSDLTGSNNTFLGSNTTWSLDAMSNATAVGANITLSQSNTVILGSSADVGIGTSTPNEQLEITKNFRIPDTSFAAQYGIIYKGANTFIHNFSYGNNGTVTTDGANTFVGESSGNLTMGSTATGSWQGSYNSGFGKNALNSVTTGYSNAGIGYNALKNNTTGLDNTAVAGNGALYNNITGQANVGIGSLALLYNVGGSYNTAVGSYSAPFNTGSYNTIFGHRALYSNTSGEKNVVMGYRAGNNANEGGDIFANNIFIGYQAANNITTGASNNLIIGYDIDAPSASGSNQLSIGNLIFGTGIDGTGTTISSGNIGIGDSTPAAKFTVGNGDLFQVNSSGAIAAATGITSSGSITFSALTLGSIPFTGTGGLISQDNSNFFWDDTNDRLGIRTATPSYPLDISNGGITMMLGADNTLNTRTNATDKNARIVGPHYTNSEEPVALFNYTSANSVTNFGIGGGSVLTNAVTTITFYTAANTTTLTGTDRMTIISDGKIGIGDTTPDYGLDVVADINSDDCFREAGAQVAGTCTSDERLKHNIISLNGSLDKVMQLRPVSFEWNENIESLGGTLRYVSGRQVGLIAQEVQNVFPDLVKEKNGYYAVEYNLELQMVALNAIQELNLKVTDLNSLDIEKENSLASRIQIFLADVTNGIKSIFVDEVHTKKLCLDDICITKQELQQILQSQNINPNSQAAPSSDTSPDTNSEQNTVIEPSSVTTEETILNSEEQNTLPVLTPEQF